MPFSTLPSSATLQAKPFQAHVSDDDLNAFTQLLRLSRLGPKTFENQVADPKDIRNWGISRDWLAQAKQHWESTYSWRATEARINSYPNFTVPIEDDGYSFDLHFVALFSKKKDAVPLALLHGWPGSFLEFLGTLDVLRQKYGEDDLPFHVIVPSLPGYAYSNGPSLEKDFDTQGIARVVDKLMVGLGFGGGYIAQGGDVGSFVARVLGVKFDACKAVHLNFCIGVDGTKDNPVSGLSREEQMGLQRAANFSHLGSAYAREHGTRPSTVGLALSASPLALLAWIGEKFLQWSDESPPLDEILDSVSLYWFTESFPRCIYTYREFFGPEPSLLHPEPAWYIHKPLGFSWHPKELSPTPKTWVEKTGNLVWYRAHQDGGHFAAMEKPAVFVKDMEDFVDSIRAKAKL